LQNKNHLRSLKELLGEDVPYYSLIVFSGNADIRKMENVPLNTYIIYINELVDYLNIVFKNDDVKYNNKQLMIEKLDKAFKDGDNEKIKKQHIERIKNKYKKSA
jgi:hypothetical protein